LILTIIITVDITKDNTLIDVDAQKTVVEQRRSFTDPSDCSLKMFCIDIKRWQISASTNVIQH